MHGCGEISESGEREKKDEKKEFYNRSGNESSL